MCEFCEKNEAGNVTPIRSGGPSEWYVDVDETDLYIEYDEQSGLGNGFLLIEIAYCPMCGRKLAERGE